MFRHAPCHSSAELSVARAVHARSLLPFPPSCRCWKQGGHVGGGCEGAGGAERRRPHYSAPILQWACMQWLAETEKGRSTPANATTAAAGAAPASHFQAPHGQISNNCRPVRSTQARAEWPQGRQGCASKRGRARPLAGTAGECLQPAPRCLHSQRSSQVRRAGQEERPRRKADQPARLLERPGV